MWLGCHERSLRPRGTPYHRRPPAFPRRLQRSNGGGRNPANHAALSVTVHRPNRDRRRRLSRRRRNNPQSHCRARNPARCLGFLAFPDAKTAHERARHARDEVIQLAPLSIDNPPRTMNFRIVREGPRARSFQTCRALAPECGHKSWQLCCSPLGETHSLGNQD